MKIKKNKNNLKIKKHLTLFVKILYNNFFMLKIKNF